MYRKQIKQIEKWFTLTSRKPLVIRGARQVGKSTIVRLFSEAVSQHLVEVNLERNPALASVFSSNDPRRIMNEIESLSNSESISKSSVLFLDEIQAIPQAISTLRYFYEEFPEVPVVAAGSLLEFAIDRGSFSMPVGRIEYLHMGPMVFGEFLQAVGENNLAKLLREYRLGDEIGAVAHERLTELQRVYLFVGGMPEAVAAYCQNQDMNVVSDVQRSIIETYREDFPKYGESRDHLRMLKVFNFCARNTGRKIKYSNITTAAQSSTLKKDLELLVMARVVTKVIHSSCNGLPLMAEANERKYKTIFLDVGLANNICGISWHNFQKIDEMILVNEGTIAEQFIGQHLLDFQATATNRNLNYWLREGKSGNAEVDFVLSFGGRVIPIEVKSGGSGSLKSLHQFSGEKKTGVAMRFDTNKPSSQRIETKFNRGGKLTPVVYDLHSFPLYLVERACQLALEF